VPTSFTSGGGSGAGIIWDFSPADLAANVEKYGTKVLDAVVATAEIIGREAEDFAKSTAPWTDRTGAARAGLQGYSEAIARTLVQIYLTHGVDYGIWLEIAMGMRYQVILPTLEAMYPRIWQVLKGLLG
jgi:hypothetical protein